MLEHRAFTLHAGRILNRLTTDALVLSDARNKSVKYMPKMWTVLWDTGATKSCITQRIADDLGLVSVGRASIGTANGYADVDTYFVHIGLPNGVMIPNVLVSCADLGANIDILIGMDIISLGDFSITNVKGKTLFSFRIPSVSEVDFVEEYKAAKKANADIK